MNPVLRQIDDWLLAYREVEPDHGGDGHFISKIKKARKSGLLIAKDMST
jgi:hypothetical protein